MATGTDASAASPSAPSLVVEEADDDIKPWDRFFDTPPPQLPEAVEEGWSLLHGGRALEDGLTTSRVVGPVTQTPS